MNLRPNPNFLASDNCSHRLQLCASYLKYHFWSCYIIYNIYTSEVSIDTYTIMLTKGVNIICPRCDKPGFLTLRWVRGSHYCKIKHPYLPSKYVEKEIIKAKADGGKDLTKSVKRWYVTYRPSIHPYIGHYDEEKYKKAMEKYKNGRLKSPS